MNTQLTKTSRPWSRAEDGIVAGVCQGIAERFEVDPWIIRIALLVSVLAFGTGLLAYFVLALTLPHENEALMPPQKKFLGVCMKISQSTGIDLGLVRALTVFCGIASAGITVVAYFVMYFVMESNDGNAVI